MSDPVAEKLGTTGATTSVVVDGDFRQRILLPGDGRLLDDFAADLASKLHDKPDF
jgi:hypothetical protein